MKAFLGVAANLTACITAVQAFHATDAPLASIPSYAAQFPGKHANTASLTVMQQCMAEQHYVRDSITRSLMYNEVTLCT